MSFESTVERVIELAVAIRTYWDAELPKHHPHYPFVYDGEATLPPPREAETLKLLLESISDEDLDRLISLMDRGRFIYYGKHDRAYNEEMKLGFPNRRDAIRYLIGKGSLSRFLTLGLAEWKKSARDECTELSEQAAAS